jgi:molybdopterin/thiamine biosynthesis adenylyltransferase
MNLNIKIIGLGGVGSILVERLCRFLNYASEISAYIILVDGDSYEQKNFNRQEFSGFGNKAEVKATDLELQFPNINTDVYPAFINEITVADVVREGDVIFLCVDNHKTRMIVNNYCKNLKDITLISGGNELTDGNVQVYLRRNGKDQTPDLGAYHPEIANPEDKLPEEMSCEELSKSEPQLYFTNLGVATIMCWSFYNIIVKNKLEASEIYFDITKMNTLAHDRVVK